MHAINKISMGTITYLRHNLTQPVLQEISDKMWTIHHHLQSDGRGLSGGTLMEQVLFEILAKTLDDFSIHHVKQSDCTILGHPLSFKKITGKSSLALNWSKNESNEQSPEFDHPILLLNMKEGKWWRYKTNFDRHIPIGFFLLDPAYCNAHVRLKTNNKTNSLMDTEDLYNAIVDAMEKQNVLELPPPSTHRLTFSFNSGFHESQKKKWERVPFETGHPRFIDLFCGVGGFHVALTGIGARCVFACDVDTACRENYKQNWGIEPDQDIRTVRESEIPPFDILCAGFPCQPFSKAGDQEGFLDKTKGNLFFEILRIAEYHRPHALILENVKNIVTHDHGTTWKTIRTSLEQIGYSVHDTPIIVSPLHYGVPQSRERAFIVGRLQSAPLPPFPLPEVQQTTIESILEIGTGNRLSGRHSEAGNIWEEFCEILKAHDIAIPRYPLWTDEWGKERGEDDPFYVKYKTWIDKNHIFYENHRAILGGWLERSRQNPMWAGALRKLEWQCDETSMKTCLWTFRGSGIRVRNLDYSPTLVAMSMIPVYGPEWRKLTPREVCRLQSFPDTYQFHPTQCYKQMGNAVNVRVVRHIAEWLIAVES